MTAPQSQSTSDPDFQELCDLFAKTQSSLRYSFHKLTEEQRSHLGPKIENLQHIIKLHQIFSLFKKTLQQVDKTWIPKGRIEQVVQAYCNQRYQNHDIERIFFEHGDINALLVLHLGTRFQNALFAQLYILPVELRGELAKQCKGEEINPLVKAWIDGYDKSRMDFDPDEELPRLDRFAKDRENRSSSQCAPNKRIRPDTKMASIPPVRSQTGFNSFSTDPMTCLAAFPSFDT